MYALFAGSNHYPAGGWNDFRGRFDSQADAYARYLSEIHEDRYFHDWYQIIDLDTLEVVESF